MNALSVTKEFEVCKEAIELLEAKAKDYNFNIPRKQYFPFGNISYAHMINTKALRYVSLAQAESQEVEPNFESIRDTLLDIINYAAIAIVELDNDRKARI